MYLPDAATIDEEGLAIGAGRVDPVDGLSAVGCDLPIEEAGLAVTTLC